MHTDRHEYQWIRIRVHSCVFVVHSSGRREPPPPVLRTGHGRARLPPILRALRRAASAVACYANGRY